jgi:hypothetical protein
MKPYRILSLDGGGIRGIFQSVLLEALAKQFPNPVLHENFDLIVGTSTGSIVGMAVALGIDPARISALYREKGKDIFARRWFAGLRKGPRYSASPLRDALKQEFGDSTLGNCHTDVYIPATILNTFSCRGFSTLTYPGTNHNDDKMLAVDAVVASCSGPTYFPAHKPANQERIYLDGGLWANSPALFGVIEAKRSGIPLDAIRVLSIGNGRIESGMLDKQFNALRPLSPIMISTLIEMMFSTQSDMSLEFLKLLTSVSQIVRIDRTLSKFVTLDDVDSALTVLPALAEAEAMKCITDNRVDFASFLGNSSVTVLKPTPDEVVGPGWTAVEGHLSDASIGPLYLLTGSNPYYPFPVHRWNARGIRWGGEVHLDTSQSRRKATVVLISPDAAFRAYIDHYLEKSKKHEDYSGIRIDDLLRACVVVASITMTIDPSHPQRTSTGHFYRGSMP